MIKFIHTGDVHLGLGFENLALPRSLASRRRGEIWTSFENIVRKAQADRVDFLFIAGDLFEEKYFTLGDIKRLGEIFELADQVDILISTGNHDTLNKNSLYHMIDWPENVYIFPNQGLTRKRYRDKNISIYGYSWDRGENTRDIFQGFPGLNKGETNVLLIHGDLYNRQSPYLPLNKGELINLGFDYIALGHIHKPEIFSNHMAYSGSPEPLNFGELGQRGIIQGEISKGETRIEFIPLAQRIFLEKEIGIDENMTYGEILTAIASCHPREELEKNFYRIILKGRVDRNIDLNMEDIYNLVEEDFYYVEIIDKTVIDYDLEALEEENKENLIGHFIREMEGKDLEDEIIKDALYVGLEVLMKGRMD